MSESNIGAPVEVRVVRYADGMMRDEWLVAVVVVEAQGKVDVRRLGGKRFPDGSEFMSLPMPPEPHMWQFKK